MDDEIATVASLPRDDTTEQARFFLETVAGNPYIPTDRSVRSWVWTMSDKRASIINAAIRVFAHKGLEKGKIADVAKEAGIGKGTVYEYFTSKEDIFSAIEMSVMGEMMDQFDRLMGESLRPRERIQRIMEKGTDAIFDMGDAVLIITELWAQGARGHWHGLEESSLAKMYDRFRDRIKTVLREGISRGEFRQMNVDGVATLILAFMDGLVWQFTLMKDEKRFSQVKTEAIRSFMKGITR
ncbi:MAG: TetR/AcrR family transcriptional regulator [Fidelibacterota bacterium]